jgi:glucosylceramidase
LISLIPLVNLRTDSIRQLRSVAAWGIAVATASITGAQGIIAEPPLPPPPPGAVQLWLTTYDSREKLALQPELAWSPAERLPAGEFEVLVDESRRYQEVDGFGATLLTPAIWSAEPAVRDEIMRLLFSRGSGIGLSVIRTTMGSTSLTGEHRTYNDVPAGQSDPELKGFSIEGDLEWRIPMMKQAKALNPELSLMGTPWSAPAWMKDSGELGRGRLLPAYRGVYANYFVRWLQAWKAQGLPVASVTMQNEPQYEPGWYQGMIMDVEDQTAFALKLGPAIKAAGLSTRIICWDHNCHMMDFPIAVLRDPEARKWIHGAAFHAYQGKTSDIAEFAAAHPDKAVYFTEQTGSYPSDGFGGSVLWHVRNVFIVPALNGARCNLLWQLDRNVESKSGDRPFVRVAPDGKSYELQGEYYETGHFSKFVRAGARRIEATRPDAKNAPLVVAYQNPDDSKVLVACNETSQTASLTIKDGARRFAYQLEGGALATFVWRDAPASGHREVAVRPAAPPPPLALEAQARSNGVTLIWNPVPSAKTYAVKRISAAGGAPVTLASGLEKPAYTDASARPGETYRYAVTASNAQSESAASAPRTVTPRGDTLPAPWKQKDIGAVAQTGFGGNAGGDGSAFTIGGSGDDIWNREDSFRFAYVPLRGDGEIFARVVAQERTSEWAKSGVMMRATLDADAPFVDVVLTPGNGVAVHARTAAGEAAEGTHGGGPFAPYWVKLVRAGTVFTGFYSFDGIEWTQAAPPVTVEMGTEIFAGLAVCARNNGTPNVTTFDSISAPGFPEPKPLAPTRLEAKAGTRSVGLSWRATALATRYQVGRAARAGDVFKPIATTLIPAYVDESAVPGTRYRYAVRAGNAGGASEWSGEITAAAQAGTATALPVGWINQDIGGVGFTGSATSNAAGHRQEGSGADIMGKADGFNFSYRILKGDGAISVQVTDVSESHITAKAGVMIRATTDADAPCVTLASTPGSGVKFHFRAKAGGDTVTNETEWGGPPKWLKLERKGSEFSAFTSPDGVSWTQLGTTVTVPMANEALVGLAVSAHTNNDLATANFVSIKTSGFGTNAK